MAKDKSEKKEKKEKKEKRAEENGVTKPKKEKKDKKDKKERKYSGADGDAATALLNQLEAEKPGSAAVQENGNVVVAVSKDEDGDVEMDGEGKALVKAPLGALVPFANPLADEKTGRKVMKAVKKGVFSPSLSSSYSRLSGACTTTTGSTADANGGVFYSRKAQSSQARRERSRQIAPQIAIKLRPYLLCNVQPLCRRRPGRRHLAHGRDIAHPRAVRGPQRAVYLRSVEGGARCCGEHEAADERGDDHEGGQEGEEGRRRGGRGGAQGSVRGFGQGRGEGEQKCEDMRSTMR